MYFHRDFADPFVLGVSGLDGQFLDALECIPDLGAVRVPGRVVCGNQVPGPSVAFGCVGITRDTA